MDAKYYSVEMCDRNGKWFPIKEYREDLGMVLFDSSERLSLEEATQRANELSYQMGWPTRVVEHED